MSERKNPTAVAIGQRIKQARRMAGLATAGQLLERIPHWGPGRLGNYEAGISMPSPEHVKLIAEVTDVSPCWIMFGQGPIRASGRDLQAIRHQNFCYLLADIKASKRLPELSRALGLSRHKLDQHIANPFLTLAERNVRKLEKFAAKPAGWLDQQHVESDPVCAAFPDDMREIMQIYSNLGSDQRQTLLQIARVFRPAT